MDRQRRALIEQHLALVEQVVLRVSRSFPRFVDRSELVSAGMLGLVEAAGRYDFDRNIPFAGFAVQRIRGAVLDVARSVDWTPRAVRNLARQAEETSQQLASRLGGQPDDETLAAALDIDPADLRRLRERVNHGVLRALDDRHTLDRADDTEALVDRSQPEPEELLESAELRGYLRSALSTLPERHRIIVVGLYLEDRSFEELAELLAVTPSRISQLRADAVEMLREGIEAQFRTRGNERPKGRVQLRQAAYAAAIAQHADWRSRLEPTTIPLPHCPGDAPDVVATEASARPDANADGDEPGVGLGVA
jgi:RNA polymerase sigma factor for flagellar operon FliA